MSAPEHHAGTALAAISLKRTGSLPVAILSSSTFDARTMDVAAHRVPCTGVARTRCLRVRVPPDTSWRFFYDPIEGFAYEEGYRWRLEVERRRVPNPPADGSSLAYRLVRVISREREP